MSVPLGKINPLPVSLPKIPDFTEVQKPKQNGFGNIFTDFIKQVNNTQINADNIAADFIKGNNNVELHDVMISAEEAKTSLQLLTEIRNKAVDMFKELSRLS
mgnify:CR=1 FL=1